MAPRLDPEIISAARRRDGAAVAAIYDAFADPIFRYVSFRVRNREDAEDLTDQVFLKMIEALPGYDERGVPFAAWLYRIARNLLVDRYRRAGREAAVELGPTVVDTRPAADPFAAASASLDQAAVRSAMTTLTEDQRLVITLRFIEGWSVEEVAEVLNRKPGAVHQLQHRALAALRRALPAREAR